MSFNTLAVESAVDDASPEKILEAGANHFGTVLDFPFIESPNPVLATDCLPYFEGYVNTQPTDLDNFVDYVAISSPIHLLTGWRYLSQSAHAFINGARSEALHLAYYAELRAALSILAGSGICILDKKHFSIEQSGTLQWFNGPTHLIAWFALNRWINRSSSITRIVRAFTVLGYNIQDWYEVFTGLSVGSDPIIQQWIRKWSIDLQEDRKLRNTKSYRPDLQPDAFKPVNSPEIQFLCNINKSFNLEQGYFESLDTAILYHLAKKSAEQNFGGFTRKKQKRFWKEVKTNLNIIKGLSVSRSSNLVERLKPIYSSDGFRIIRDADPHKKDTQAVFSRALLLIRLATVLMRGQWQEMRNRFGDDLQWQNDLVFQYSKVSNVWFDESNPPDDDDYSILNEDGFDALETIETELEDSFVRERLFNNHASSLAQLCRLERLALLAVSS